MAASINQEWLNQNSYRNYPFLEDQNTNSLNSNILLPNYFIVDLIITTAGDAAIRLFLKRVVTVGTFITLVFEDENGNTVFNVAFDILNHTTYQAYNLAGVNLYEDARGVIVIGDLTRLRDDLPDGDYSFNIECEAATVRPDLRGVRSLKVGNGANLSDFIRGHVKLIEGNNIRLTYIPQVNGIRIDAISGAGLNQTCDCEDIYQPPDCIRTINGIDINNLQIIGDGKCVEISTQGNTIIIKDKCSEPCCGCEELESITTNLAIQEATLSRLEAYGDLFRERIDGFITTILTSSKGG